ncbi:MAG: tRNA-dihydrouridine synthase family protein [Candidatus Diapherotrites archaeon]|nr:tRNA-dihydrouridine synthase family protein [Candidatus Diapherotrites archaeon]
MKIGNLKIDKGAFLAPMADYTNIAFRTLAKEYGSALGYTELISCKSIIHKNSKTKKMLEVSAEEKPVFLQLFGNDPLDFASAIKIVEKDFKNNFVGYDLNCGCSVPKAIRGKYGCYIMDFPKLVGNIVRAMKKATTKPVTVKLRLGLAEETYLAVALEAQDAGADAICLHARLGKQGFGGKADLAAIKKLKENVKVPVIGNGDVTSVESYKKMKKETNCDFVMVGRGAIGNAFIFKQIQKEEKKQKVPERTEKEFLNEGTRFIELAKEFSLGVNDCRGYFIGLANGFVGAKTLRGKFGMSKTIKELEKHFNDFFSN